MTRSRPLAERFWEKVDQSGNCWLWTASTLKGYGAIQANGRLQGAHRVSYEMANGPIPKGMQIDHLCRTPLCVRPSHLEVVTPRVNQLRSFSPSGMNARKTACPRSHLFDAANTYIDKTGRRHCRACSREQMRERRGEATYRRSRREAMHRAIAAGLTNRQIAEAFGITRVRAWQVRQAVGR